MADRRALFFALMLPLFLLPGFLRGQELFSPETWESFYNTDPAIYI
jgi:hypothetical protein